MRTFVTFLILLGTAAAAAAQEASPLFAGQEPIRIVLTGPISSLQGDRSETPRPATLTLGAEAHSVTLAPRGITRRMKDICHFPPLRVRFVPPPAQGLFAGQQQLKLVTHCRAPERFQDHVLLEYAAYRMLNRLTPQSLNVRLAQIAYRNPDGRPLVTRAAFFIEDWDGAARRLGMSRPRVGDAVARTQLSPAEAARAALFAYMIGNLDWSMRVGPKGEGCCHNFRLLSPPGSARVVPIPYDFDFSGLVDAPYAQVPEGLRLNSVRERQYRGYCMHNAEAVAAAADFRGRQAELMTVVSTVPGLSDGSKRRASAYIGEFFRDIATEEKLRSKVLRTCIR
ncbi:hypothetical protein [Sphingomonas arenae]|uniref:hypothetical protein n=1 Tax=Sphingomonas arenae TaxID=2812555 RepID=UPI001967E4F1|nr:hypothetical protein [Sphingomonas arenae]